MERRQLNKNEVVRNCALLQTPMSAQPVIQKPKRISTILITRDTTDQPAAIDSEYSLSTSAENSEPIEVCRTPGNSHSYTKIDQWTIKPHGVGICVEGHRRSDPADTFWSSSAIIERVHRHVVKSSSGSVYKLVGEIVEPLALAAGFSLDFVREFRQGFPRNWHRLVFEHHAPASSRTSRLDDDSLSESKTEKKLTETAKRKKRVKEAQRSIISPSKNTEKYLPNVTVDIGSCPQSRRSGRHIIPPLAWWTNERILIDPITKTTQIVPGKTMLSPRAAHNSRGLVSGSFSVSESHLERHTSKSSDNGHQITHQMVRSVTTMSVLTTPKSAKSLKVCLENISERESTRCTVTGTRTSTIRLKMGVANERGKEEPAPCGRILRERKANYVIEETSGCVSQSSSRVVDSKNGSTESVVEEMCYTKKRTIKVRMKVRRSCLNFENSQGVSKGLQSSSKIVKGSSARNEQAPQANDFGVTEECRKHRDTLNHRYPLRSQNQLKSLVETVSTSIQKFLADHPETQKRKRQQADYCSEYDERPLKRLCSEKR